MATQQLSAAINLLNHFIWVTQCILLIVVTLLVSTNDLNWLSIGVIEKQTNKIFLRSNNATAEKKDSQ